MYKLKYLLGSLLSEQYRILIRISLAVKEFVLLMDYPVLVRGVKYINKKLQNYD